MADPSLSGQSGNAGGMQEITLAVLGAAKTGKSTFVQCALDLKKPAVSAASIKKVSLEGATSVLRLVELSIDEVGMTINHEIDWPERLGDQAISRIDGALLLYDVTNQDSIAQVPSVLDAFSDAAIPTVLVSSKCDKDLDSWEIEHRMIDGVWTVMNGVESFQTSLAAPETHKRCLSVMLRTIMSEKEEDTPIPTRPTRPRALTYTQQPRRDSASSKSKHGRAVSELPSTLTHGRDLRAGEAKPHGKPTISSSAERTVSETKEASEPPHASSNCATAASSNTGVLGEDSLTTAPKIPERSRPTINTPTTVTTSFLDIEDDNGAQPPNVQMIQNPSDDSLQSSPNATSQSGVSFDELVDRLLSRPMSKYDVKFAAIFLCLYRKFAAPSDLLSAIIHRFKQLKYSKYPQILRLSSQLRYLNILAQWISEYPGDFAHASTRRNMTGFVTGLAADKVFAVASKEMSSYLDAVSEDDDTEWACSDNSRMMAKTMECSPDTSSVQTRISTLDAVSFAEDIASEPGREQGIKRYSTKSSVAPSSSSSADRSATQSTGSFQTLLNSVEHAQRQAQLLTPIPRNALTKTHWHQLMESSDDDIAHELTRIDWIMFTSIRPRDLVRHVILPADQKENCKNVENVNRMINHFNHVAFWVANMILLRNKAKHRAKALEKFMGVAWKLRYMNNYNSLGAVIAGINGTAVHRLMQTRELVSPQAQKQFMRLEILMGTAKSHFAYRLAWSNTSSERIPFLPLHRRDLVFAEEGNRTLVGEGEERVNWKKFEVMGEVIVEIQKSQGTPYPTISRNEELQRLILDGNFSKDDDELYERSIQIEGPGAGETRRKFNWFQR